MSYEEFERIGMDEGAPYALCKMTWEWKPWERDCLVPNPLAIRMMFRIALSVMPEEAMAALRKVSALEIEEGALESMARKWMDNLRGQL